MTLGQESLSPCSWHPNPAAAAHQAPPGPKACAHGASSAPCPTAHSPQAVSELGSAAPQPCVPFQVGFHADPGQAAAVSTFPCCPGAAGGRDLSQISAGVGQPGAMLQGPGVRAELGHLRGRGMGPHCPQHKVAAGLQGPPVSLPRSLPASPPTPAPLGDAGCPKSSHLALKQQFGHAEISGGAAPWGADEPESPRLTDKVTRGRGPHCPHSLAAPPLFPLQVPGVLGAG